MLALPLVLGLTACGVSDHPVTVNDNPGGSDFKPEVLTMMSSVWIADGVDDDMRQAFSWAVARVDSRPADATIFVLNKLTDLNEADLKFVVTEYLNDGLICLMNPSKADIDAYCEAHDWIDIDTSNITDSLLMFGFNGVGSRYYIQKPTAIDGNDPLLASMNRAQDYYVFISSMLTDFTSRITAGGDDDGDTKRLEDFAGHYHEAVSKNFIVHQNFREIIFSDPDVLKGSISLTAIYDIYMAHVYEGEPGEGDYYGVKMSASVASAGLWKGKGWNTHGGVYVRWCGAYCKHFTVESHLISGNDWNEDTSDRIMFTAGGVPSPNTTVGQTEYEDYNSFSLNLSESVSAGKGSEGSKKSKSIEAKVEVSQGWTWSHDEKRNLSDVDIINETKNANWPRWTLQFNNLPEFQWTQDYGFNPKNNLAARGTMILNGSWLWYDKSGKDNQDRDPYTMCTYLTATHEIQSFITTKADLDATEVKKEGKFTFKLPKMTNTTAGSLKLKNDLPDGMTLSTVEVTDAATGELVTEFRNTIPNGGEETLGYLNSNLEYQVTFKGKKNGEEARTYKYTLHPTVILTHKQATTLYAASDFTAQ